MKVGERIKQLRIAKDLTQDDLANAVKTTKQTIHKYETGIISVIPPDKVVAIAELLGTSPSYIMGWDELDKKIEDNKAEEAKKEKDSPPDFSFYYDLSEESRAKLMEVAQFLLAQQNKE